jgi:hypothetical protein
MEKSGAIELSIGTIVVIVLAMSMLILGLVLVKNIFGGATYNIDTMNEKVKGEISKLFVEDRKTVIYLENSLAKINQGKGWGVAFAIKNLRKGTVEAGDFSYEVVVSDPNVKKNCGVEESYIQNWIKTGQADSKIMIVPGDIYYGLVRFSVPDGAPLCTVRFHLRVKEGGQTYATDFFDVEVMA